MTASVEIAVAVECPAWSAALPAAEALCRRAARAALAGVSRARAAMPAPSELSILLADDARVRILNRAYRKKDKPTNVLSFPALPPSPRKKAAGRPARAAGAASPPLLLGDVILAFETVRDEASAQGKPLAHHLAHLVVHGTLHLLGYDHLRAAEATRMERLETEILAKLRIRDPYRPAAPRPRAAARGTKAGGTRRSRAPSRHAKAAAHG